MKHVELEIMSEIIRLDEVKSFLENQPQWGETQIALDLKKPKKKYRASLDPTILVAIISVGGMILTAVINGLLQIAKEKNIGEIVLVAGEQQVKIPANIPLDEVKKYVEIVREMLVEQSDVERVKILLE